MSAWLKFYKTPARRMLIDPFKYASGSFIPTDIAGCLLWLQGDNAPSGLVANWPDNSGNGNDAVEATNKPTKVSAAINGHDAVAFIQDAGGNKFLISPAAWTTNRTVVFVAKILTAAGSYGGIDVVCTAGSDFNNGMIFLDNIFGSTTQTYYAGAGTVYLDGSVAAAPPGNYPTSSYGVGTDKGAFLATDTTIKIGAGSGGIANSISRVEIAELIVYNSNLSTFDRERVEDYLGAKYAITIIH